MKLDRELKKVKDNYYFAMFEMIASDRIDLTPEIVEYCVRSFIELKIAEELPY